MTSASSWILSVRSSLNVLLTYSTAERSHVVSSNYGSENAHVKPGHGGSCLLFTSQEAEAGIL